MANNRVELADGTVLMDISDTTAEASDVAAGKAFYSASGVRSLGTGNYMNPVANPTANDVLVTDTNGQAVDSGVSISDLGTVKSVNGQTGTVVLQASDVGALPDDTDIPANTSDLTNDSGFITGMVILSYGNSTWQDFIEAYTAQKVVYCRASSNSNPASGSQTRLAFMAYVNNAAATSITEVEFQYYRSVSSHSVTQQGDQVYVYKLNKNNGWSVTVRENYTRITAGTNLAQSYSNGVLTLNLNSAVTDEISDLNDAINEGVAKSVQAIDYITDLNDMAEYSPYYAAGRVKMFRVKVSTLNLPAANVWGLTEVIYANGANQFVQYFYSSAGLWRRVAPGDNTLGEWIKIGDQHYHKGDTFNIIGGSTLMAVVGQSGTSGGATVTLPKEIGSDVASYTWTGSFNFFAEASHPNGITGLTITGISKTASNALGISFSFPSGTTVTPRTFGFINPLNMTITFN